MTSLTGALDRWVNSFTWAPDSARLFFTTGDRGRQAIQFIPVTGGAIRIAASGDSDLDDMQFTHDGKTMVYTAADRRLAHRDLSRRVHGRRAASALTHLNDATLAALPAHAARRVLGGYRRRRPRAELRGEALRLSGRTVKYPVLMLIHGGPQGNWGHTTGPTAGTRRYSPRRATWW